MPEAASSDVGATDLETRIDLLRHGQCQGGEIFRGSTDVALTEAGWGQMRAQLDLYSPGPWQRIISSPLQRCHEFARETAQRLTLPLTVESDLREMHFGDWEGQEHAHIWETDPLLRLWGEDPEKYTPPGGEPLAVFAERVIAALTRLAQTHAGEHLLVVTHGGVIRLLLTWAQALDRRELRRMHVPYAHFAALRWHEGKLALMEVGVDEEVATDEG